MPLSIRPEYPQGYNPDNSWRPLEPRDGRPAAWCGGVTRIARLLHERQGLVFADGSIYKIPIGHCVACLIQLPIEALEVFHVIPYESLAGRASSPQDLVNMHNDTSNLTFVCRNCHASWDEQPFYDWLLETVRLQESQTRLARVELLRSAWLKLEELAAREQEHARSVAHDDVLGALGKRSVDPHLTPRDQAAARMARIGLAVVKLLNEKSFHVDFSLGRAVELVACHLEADLKQLVQQGQPRPLA